MGARQVQEFDTHLSPFRYDGHPFEHARLRLLNHARVELFGDMVEYVLYGRGEVCMLKELAHLAQVPAGSEVKQGGCGRSDVGQAERGKAVPFPESLSRRKDIRGAVHDERAAVLARCSH